MTFPLNPHPEISIVIPVYNEEKNVEEAMRRIQAFMSLKDQPWECLIVNDGSRDRTERIVREALASQAYPHFYLLSDATNRGKGFAVRQGVLASQGRFVLVSDVDLSSPIKELNKLLKAMEEGFDIAIGSRAVHSPGCDVQQSFKRWLAGRIFNLFVRILALKGISDTQCGFKCFKKEAAHRLFTQQKLDGFSFDVEVLCLARKNGMKIKEVPVMWRQGQQTRVQLFQDSYKMVRDLFYLRTSSTFKN